MLRTAAGEVARQLPFVEYFPSFEIIMNPARKFSLFTNDLREISPLGVKVVMKNFEKFHLNISEERKQDNGDESNKSEKMRNFQVVCDEDLIEYDQ